MSIRSQDEYIFNCLITYLANKDESHIVTDSIPDKIEREIIFDFIGKFPDLYKGIIRG